VGIAVAKAAVPQGASVKAGLAAKTLAPKTTAAAVKAAVTTKAQAALAAEKMRAVAHGVVSQVQVCQRACFTCLSFFLYVKDGRTGSPCSCSFFRFCFFFFVTTCLPDPRQSEDKVRALPQYFRAHMQVCQTAFLLVCYFVIRVKTYVEESHFVSESETWSQEGAGGGCERE
jgi:hypothetical protein